MLNEAAVPAGRRTRIAIILGAPPSAQNLDRIGARQLGRFFDVKVLDCTRVVGRIWEEALADRTISVESVTDIAEFREWMACSRPDYAIDFIGWTKYTPAIFRILRDLNIRIVIQSLAAKPSGAAAARGMRLLLHNPLRVTKAVVSRVVKQQAVRTISADVALLAGLRSVTAESRRAQTIIWTGSRDYHEYRRTPRDPTVAKGTEFIVFLDEAMVNSSDYRLVGLRQPVATEDYYSLLNGCFTRLEEMTGMTIVVAAHPNGKSDVNYPSYFGNRMVRFDSTAALCAASNLVLLHASTAASYAVLWRRPTLVLTSVALDRSWQRDAIRSMGHELKCPTLFMDAADGAYRSALARCARPDLEAYERYRRNYLVTDDVRESEPWQSFINYVQGSAASIEAAAAARG